MTDQEQQDNYKGRIIIFGISHSGSNGPYEAHFSISSKHGDGWEIDHQCFIEKPFDDREIGFAAAHQAAREWIDAA